MTNTSYDVVVVGGGPGGSSTGTILAQRGYRVLLLEKEKFPRFHVGESLLPGAWELWDQLGVTGAIEAAGFAVKQGANFGMFDQPDEITLLTGEYPEYFQRPYSFHADRATFDTLLLDNARSAGVEVREEWAVADVIFEGEQAVGVMAGPVGGTPEPIAARVVVDASGRSCMLARKLGWRNPDPALNKLAYFTHVEGADMRLNNGTCMTDIHTIEGGWIWYIPLSKGRVSVGAVLDAQHTAASGIKGVQERFDAAIARCPRIREWMRGSTQVEPVHTISNISYLNDSFVGDGFVLVGDASMFVDPIFSAGVTIAIRGGIFAAESIDEALRAGEPTADRLRGYETRIRHPMKKIFSMIYNWYGILERQDRNNIFARSQRVPILRERLIVLLSGGYDKVDMEALLSGAEV